MGFFKKIGRAFGSCVEKVGDFLGSERVSRWGRNIQDACAERVGSENSYSKETADISSTERLNEILVSFSTGYHQQACSIENSCIQYVENYYDNLIQALLSASKSSSIRLNINTLKRGRDKIKMSIQGSICNPLARKMSLDDRECLNILKMDAGQEKTKAMSAFSQKIIREALQNLTSTVRTSMNEQLSDVEEYLRDISEEREKEYSKLMAQFEKICKDDLEETNKKEVICVDSLLVMDATDCIKGVLA